jgi:hypothetical protein
MIRGSRMARREPATEVRHLIMTKFEEMCDIATKARRKALERRKLCRQHMTTLVEELISYCGIPQDRVAFYTWTSEDNWLPPDEKRSYIQSAMDFDSLGNCRLGIEIDLSPPGQYPNQWVSLGLYVEEQDGKVTVQLGVGKKYPFDTNSSSQRHELYGAIVDLIMRAYAEPHKGKEATIGFRTTPAQTEDDNKMT